MNFATMRLLEKIKGSYVEAQQKNIFYRLIYKIMYRYNTKKVIKQVDKYLRNSAIDAEHMLDIIHTLHVFCSTGIISDEERRSIFMFSLSERDGSSILKYDKKTPNGVSRYEEVITGEIMVKITDPIIHMTETKLDDIGRKSMGMHAAHFSDDINHNFYNTAGRALLFGIKKYLEYDSNIKTI